MRQGVAVRVPGQPGLALEVDATQHQAPALLKGVYVVAGPDAHRGSLARRVNSFVRAPITRYADAVSLAPSDVTHGSLMTLPGEMFPSSEVDNAYYAELKQRVRDANL